MAELKTEQERVRKLLPYYIVFLVLGFIFIRWGFPAFTAFVEKQGRLVALRVYIGILTILGLSFLPVGIFGFRLSRRMIDIGQMPPRIKEFVGRSNLEEGELARRTGRLYYFMSWVLVLGSFGLVTLCYLLYRSFTNH